MGELPPCVIFEDEHLLVVNKPAGMNTHSPAPCALEGIYEWLKHREPRWADLAIIHRLDKETSGVMVFGKTPLANKSLTEQFTQHTIQKKYLLLTDQPVKAGGLKVVSSIVRVGEKYASRPPHAGGDRAETEFRAGQTTGRYTLVEARPATGRTHQIRVQAAAEGFPVLGDTLYGGGPGPRLCLHAAELELKHPATGRELAFTVPVDFWDDTSLALRGALIDPRDTDAFRVIHGHADRRPGWQVDRLGDNLLSQVDPSSGTTPLDELHRLMKQFKAQRVYEKVLAREVRKTSASPRLLLGEAEAGPVIIRENGVKFELSFSEGYSVGLFLDQRENRRRFLTNHVAADFPLFPGGAAGAEVLNTFAYTCGFSVCAAKAGAHTTSLDLSKKYLDWGKRNFALNGLDAGAHDFIFGDAFDWMKRLAKKGRAFDAIVLDPPTFSQSKEGGAFQAGKDYGRLMDAALPLLKPGGALFASTNAAKWEPEKFLETLASSAKSAGRKILRQHYVPQPPDFPVHRDEPAYLKTVWLRIG